MGQSTSRSQTKPALSAPVSRVKLSSKVALGAGCYWGTEKFVRQDFQERFPGAIKDMKVGFMNPNNDDSIPNPTYEQVCKGETGYVEVLLVELKYPEIHFEELIRFFFMFHDPTTLNQQGNDHGFQYSSWIFCGDDEQDKIADKVRLQLQNLITAGSLPRIYERPKVMTKITRLSKFVPAHEEHQDYLTKNPNGYCNHRLRLNEWLAFKLG
jgi:peptide-methionine (S)-S-oxide reductase